MKIHPASLWIPAQAGIKIAGRNINNLRNADDTTLMAESEEGLKSLLIKVKRVKKPVLNSTLKKHHGIQSWASLVAQLVKNHPAMWETWV